MSVADASMPSDHTRKENSNTDVREVCFDDGNILLRAGNRLFRVWKSWLSARSPVFEDMFGFPPAEDQERIQGCPVVNLSDDADEVTYLLKALFHSNFFMPPPAPTEYAIAAGILRLSHKYNVGYLFHRAILHLNIIAPMSLQAFEERANIRTVPQFSYLLADFWNLIRETGTSWMLPSVGYYCAAALDVPEIIHGQTRNTTTSSLSPADQSIILNAKHQLETAK